MRNVAEVSSTIVEIVGVINRNKNHLVKIYNSRNCVITLENMMKDSTFIIIYNSRNCVITLESSLVSSSYLISTTVEIVL